MNQKAEQLNIRMDANEKARLTELANSIGVTVTALVVDAIRGYRPEVTHLEVTPGLTLTTSHAASSYGIPVLVDVAMNAYGPGDVVPQLGATGVALVRAFGDRHPQVAEFCMAYWD